MRQETAEAIGAEALAWLAGEDDLLGVFLGSSGLSAAELGQNASNPEILGAVLDFLLMDDAWITQFCDRHSYEYDLPSLARMALPGGANPHWT